MDCVFTKWLPDVTAKYLLTFNKSEGKGHPRTGHKDPQEEYRYSCNASLITALDGCGWSTPRPGRFTPGKEPVRIV
jgi:hypothetical protein